MFLDGELGSRYLAGDFRVKDQLIANLMFPNVVQISAHGNISVRVSPPPGVDRLTVGTYESAEHPWRNTAGHPGLDMWVEQGIGCNDPSGRFTIHELEFGADGNPSVFAMNFEWRCGGARAAIFGSISYNATSDFYARRLSSQQLDFGHIATGQTQSLTETITNSGQSPLRLSQVAISGLDQSQFALTGNTCALADVPVGESCTLTVRFTPGTTVGPRNATLSFHDGLSPFGGKPREIPLTGQLAQTDGEFTALTPNRILDTRDGTGGYDVPLGARQTMSVKVTGTTGVPTSGVSAVVLNATAVNPTAQTYLTLWPTGGTAPVVSNVNASPREVRPNLVTVAVGSGGQVSVYNDAGRTHIILDVVGFYSDAAGPVGSRFHSLDPFRLFDTRDGTDGVAPVRVQAGQILNVNVAGRVSLPSAGTTAVVLNVTVTKPTATSYLTVFPGDVGPPTASNLNFVAHQEVANLVTVRVPANGSVNILNAAGATHILADVVGYYDTKRSSGAGRFVAVSPLRLVDTRAIPGAKLLADDYGVLTVDGAGGVPIGGADAAVLNVTATNTTDAGYLTVFPDDNCQIPKTSSVNFLARTTVPNLVITRLSEVGPCAVGAGRVDVYNANGSTDVIIDLFGYFTKT